MEEIHPQVTSNFSNNYTYGTVLFLCILSLGLWVLENVNVYSPFPGVTNNQSESFNATLKRLQKVPEDTILSPLYHI